MLIYKYNIIQAKPYFNNDIFFVHIVESNSSSKIIILDHKQARIINQIKLNGNLIDFIVVKGWLLIAYTEHIVAYNLSNFQNKPQIITEKKINKILQVYINNDYSTSFIFVAFVNSSIINRYNRSFRVL